MPESATAALYALYTDRAFNNAIRTVEDLSPEEMNALVHPGGNSIAWDVWHLVRTIDNIVFFAFDRTPPVWLQGEFDTKFGLPRVAQGTGMATDEAQALRFPEAAVFLEYVRAAQTAVVERIRGMSEEYLAEAVLIRPWGEVARTQHLLQILVHANGHLGQGSMARALIGHEALGY